MTFTAPSLHPIVLSRFSSAIAHHALKSPDRLFERNSKRSRKIVTAPCCAKKLEKCHVKHFQRIKTQVFRPSLPPDPDHAKKIGNSADRAPFTIPDCRRFSCRHKQSIALHAVAGNPLCHNNSLGMPRPKTASILSKYEQIWQSDQNNRHGALNRKSATTNSTHDYYPKPNKIDNCAINNARLRDYRRKKTVERFNNSKSLKPLAAGNLKSKNIKPQRQSTSTAQNITTRKTQT